MSPDKTRTDELSPGMSYLSRDYSHVTSTMCQVTTSESCQQLSRDISHLTYLGCHVPTETWHKPRDNRTVTQACTTSSPGATPELVKGPGNSARGTTFHHGIPRDDRRIKEGDQVMTMTVKERVKHT